MQIRGQLLLRGAGVPWRCMVNARTRNREESARPLLHSVGRSAVTCPHSAWWRALREVRRFGFESSIVRFKFDGSTTSNQSRGSGRSGVKPNLEPPNPEPSNPLWTSGKLRRRCGTMSPAACAGSLSDARCRRRFLLGPVPSAPRRLRVEASAPSARPRDRSLQYAGRRNVEGH